MRVYADRMAHLAPNVSVEKFEKDYKSCARKEITVSYMLASLTVEVDLNEARFSSSNEEPVSSTFNDSIITYDSDFEKWYVYNNI